MLTDDQKRQLNEFKIVVNVNIIWIRARGFTVAIIFLSPLDFRIAPNWPEDTIQYLHERIALNKLRTK